MPPFSLSPSHSPSHPLSPRERAGVRVWGETLQLYYPLIPTFSLREKG